SKRRGSKESSTTSLFALESLGAGVGDKHTPNRGQVRRERRRKTEISRSQKADTRRGRSRWCDRRSSRVGPGIDQECQMEVKKLSVSLIVFFSLILAIPFDSDASFFNWGSCLRWRITGICRIVCTGGSCHVWVTVRHWRPEEVSETVNIPGDSICGERFAGLMASLCDAVFGWN